VKFALEHNFQVHVLMGKEQSPTLRIYLHNSITFQSRNELRDLTDAFLGYSVRGL